MKSRIQVQQVAKLDSLFCCKCFGSNCRKASDGESVADKQIEIGKFYVFRYKLLNQWYSKVVKVLKTSDDSIEIQLFRANDAHCAAKMAHFGTHK